MAKLPEKSAKQASSQGRKDGGKAPVKREQAAVQAEERRIRKEEKLHWKRIRRGRRRRLFLVSFLLSLVFVGIYYSYVALSIHFRNDGTDEALPVLIFTNGQREADSEWSVQEVSFGGGTYLPVTMLEEYMAISQYGDYETRSFLLSVSGEYASFFPGSTRALVNGQTVYLEYPPFLLEGELYLPVDFFEYKMNCFDYTHSSALAANVLTFYPDRTPSLCFDPEDWKEMKALPAPILPPEPLSASGM
jgi:hypothetical protein